MEEMIYLAVSILFLVFGICTAIADTLLFHYSTSRFKNLPLKYREFLDVSLSSSNKYKGSDSKQGPRFFGSTTIFVVFTRSEEHTSELQSRPHLVCRLLLEKKKNKHPFTISTSGQACLEPFLAYGPVTSGTANTIFMLRNSRVVTQTISLS